MQIAHIVNFGLNGKDRQLERRQQHRVIGWLRLNREPIVLAELKVKV